MSKTCVDYVTNINGNEVVPGDLLKLEFDSDCDSNLSDNDEPSNINDMKVHDKYIYMINIYIYSICITTHYL